MESILGFFTQIKTGQSPALIIKDKSLSSDQVMARLTESGQTFLGQAIEVDGDKDVLLEKIKEAEAKKSWILIDINSPQVPPWLYQRLKNFSATGHWYDYSSGEDINLSDSPVRLVFLMTDADLEACPFDDLLSCFGFVFRNDNQNSHA